MKKVLEILKKNLLSLICGLVAIVFLVVTFVWPLPGNFADLRARVSASQEQHSSLSSLVSSTYTAPLLNVDETEAKPLDIFPNDATKEAAQKALDALKEQADKLQSATLSLTNVEPLDPEGRRVFPRIASGSSERLVLQQFRNAYLNATAIDPTNFPNSVYARITRGGLAPTLAELSDIEKRQEALIRQQQTIFGPDSRPTNLPAVEEAVAKMRSELPRQIKQRRAEQSRIYFSPGAVLPHPALAQVGGQAGAAASIDLATAFNAQYSLWLQEMALRAIADVNRNATNVYDAPIKHLVRLDIGQTGYNFGPSSTGGFAPGTEAAPAIEPSFNASLPISRDYSTGPFGHPRPNDLYETNTIDIEIIVDARKVPQIISSLTAGRYLFVNQVSLSSVDTGIAFRDGYLYGPDQVVRLNLRVDILIIRSALGPWLPDAVKAYLATRNAPPMQ